MKCFVCLLPVESFPLVALLHKFSRPLEAAHAPRLFKFIVAQSDRQTQKAGGKSPWFRRAYVAKLIEVYGFPTVGQWAERPFIPSNGKCNQ